MADLVEEKNAENTIKELERLLDKQEADMVLLRNERK